MERGIIHHLGPFDVPGLRPGRMVRVYLPRRLRPRSRPLLLMFDGQNIFDDGPSFAGGWHVHEAVERLSKGSCPPIVVGVDHGHEERIVELSAFSHSVHEAKLELLLSWIRSALLPLLAGQLHIAFNLQRVVIGGSSMGGFAALYAHLRYPSVFGGALAMSPSLWVAGGALLRVVATDALPTLGKIYLDAGHHEAGGKMLRQAAEFAGLLHHKGASKLLFRADAKGYHREADWRRRLPRALRFHFAPGHRRS